MIVELMTELGAVNAMLASIGERPVNALGSSSRFDVIRAENALAETLRLVQTRGWWFNTLEDLEVSPGGGEYVFGTNTLKVKHIRTPRLGKRGDRVYVLRGDVGDGGKLKLFNKQTRSFTGNTETICVDLVEGLSFEEMPETARAYTARRAGVTFQARSLASRILHEFTEVEAAEAWRLLVAEDIENESDRTLRTAPLNRELLQKR